ncbi:MAG: tRNA threonylcarbamoyladenosine dehydratase [Turicibacter sp.]|nr:tRNA threonylcarbamoyladenosine dehydratase [Turicibacter sp.]
MLHSFSRTELLTGRDGLQKLKGARVAVFGVGGVGGYVVEALARSGVGTLDIIDDDKVCLTNLNRQVIATRKTVGKYKVEVMKERILEINPRAIVNTYQTFYLPENAHEFNFSQYDYVVDAIDTMSGKIALVMQAQESGTKIISSMGAGNKLHPEMLELADLYSTSMCPLARTMRRELKKRGVKKLTVVYSKEKPIKPKNETVADCKVACICPKDTQRTCTIRREIPGSVSFVPSAAGLIMAGKIVRDLISE